MTLPNRLILSLKVWLYHSITEHFDVLADIPASHKVTFFEEKATLRPAFRKEQNLKHKNEKNCFSCP
jgi:hypothetical protein